MLRRSIVSSCLLLCAALPGNGAQAAVLTESELQKGAKQIEAACLADPAQLKAPYVKQQDYPAVCNCIAAKSVEQLRHADVADGIFRSVAATPKAIEAGKAAGAVCLQPAFRASIEHTMYEACLAHNPNFSAFDALPENQLPSACSCASAKVGSSLTLDKFARAQANGSTSDGVNQLLADTVNTTVRACMKR